MTEFYMKNESVLMKIRIDEFSKIAISKKYWMSFPEIDYGRNGLWLDKFSGIQKSPSAI